VIVMAQLVGVPVVATDPEGAAELIPSGTGTIVSPSHDPAALAEVLMEYRNDPARRRREAAAARAATLSRHDPERILREVEQALGLSETQSPEAHQPRR
jgi:glycosyltransferase involved in cell wall biosynthesis